LIHVPATGKVFGEMIMKRLTSSATVLVVAFATLMHGGADIGRADNLYYAGTNDGVNWSLGTVNGAGNKTPIATGLTFGGAGAEKLIFAPNGTLYGFDVETGGGSDAWGSINPATGAFTQIGNLDNYFPPAIAQHNENNGFSLAFGSSGTLYVTGKVAPGTYKFGTLDLTTGAFTNIAASPVGLLGSIAAPVPEPSTIVLFGIAVISLAACRWRRAR
jgi:hypothetical protein